MFTGESVSLSNDVAFSAASVIFNIIAAAAGGLLLFACGYVINHWREQNQVWHQLVWGPVAIVLVYSLVIILHIGLIGRDLPEDRREWWSRLGAVLMVWLIGWVSLVCVSIYGPRIIPWIKLHILAKIIASGALFSWICTTVAGIMKAHSANTGPMGS